MGMGLTDQPVELIGPGGDLQQVQSAGYGFQPMFDEHWLHAVPVVVMFNGRRMVKSVSGSQIFSD